MYCAACDRMEWSDLGVDTETCMRCGGFLCQAEDDDDQPSEAEEWHDFDPDC